MREIVLAGIFFLFLHGAAAAEMVSIAADLVNMRSGPGPEHEVTWELGKGYPLKVLETQGQWLKVTDFQDDIGWVQKDMVTSKPYLIVKNRIINVRSGPGEKYRIVRQAQSGVVFRPLEKKGNWVKVQHEEEGVSGWVLRSLLWGW
ncbi:MAG: SH3 domain-containing protein [Pseudomonadota bacterium]